MSLLRALTVGALALSALLGAPASAQSPGTLDLSFGGDGLVATDFGQTDEAYDVAVFEGGSVLAVGETVGPEGGFFALARYAPDGDLDASFGEGGRVRTSFEALDSRFIGSRAQAVAVQPDGRLVVAGGTGAGTEFALARYLPSGALDPDFGDGGLVLTDLGGSVGGTTAFDVLLQPDGRVVAVGIWDLRITAVRFGPDGTLDPTFGDGGVARVDLGAPAIAWSAALLGDGRVVVAGDSDMDVVVLRLGVDGALDPTFGDGGVVRFNFDEDGAGQLLRSNETAQAVALTPGGGVVVAGWVVPAAEESNSDVLLLRLTEAGTLDPSFGDGGVVTADVEFSDFVYSLAVQPDGRSVVSGSTLGDALQVRFLADGSRDVSFGEGGVVRTDYGDIGDTANAVTLDGDGRIVTAGSTGGPEENIAVARYTGGSAPTATDPRGGDRQPALLVVTPNPVQTKARVVVGVAAPQAVRVEVVDTVGRRISLLHDGTLAAGSVPLALDVGSLAPGVYWVRAMGPGWRSSRPMVVAQ